MSHGLLGNPSGRALKLTQLRRRIWSETAESVKFESRAGSMDSSPDSSVSGIESLGSHTATVSLRSSLSRAAGCARVQNRVIVPMALISLHALPLPRLLWVDYSLSVML